MILIAATDYVSSMLKTKYSLVLILNGILFLKSYLNLFSLTCIEVTVALIFSILACKRANLKKSNDYHPIIDNDQ